MNADYYCPWIPPAGILLERPKSIQKAAETYGFRSSLYSSRVLIGLRHPGLSTGNYMSLSMATAILHPCKEAVPASLLKGRSSMIVDYSCPNESSPAYIPPIKNIALYPFHFLFLSTINSKHPDNSLTV